MYLVYNCPLFHFNYLRTLSSHVPCNTHNPPQLHVLLLIFIFFSFKPPNRIIAAPNEHRYRANLWQMGSLPGTILLMKTDFPSPSSYRLLIVPQLRMGSHELLPSPCWNALCIYEVLYGQLYNAYIQIQPCTTGMNAIAIPCPEDTVSFLSSPNLELTVFLSLVHILWVMGEEGGSVTLMSQLWLSTPQILSLCILTSHVLITVYWKMKVL